MATKAATNPPNTAMHPVKPVSRPPEAAFLVGGQLTKGLTAAQAVAVRAAEMLLAVAEPTWTAHGLPATSDCTSEIAQVLRPSYCAGTATSSVPVRLKAEWLMLEHEAPAVAATRSGGWAPF